MTNAAPTLPHWDVSVLYSGLDAPELDRDLNAVIASIGELEALFDHHGVRKSTDGAPAYVSDETVAAAEAVIRRFNAVAEATQTIGAYLNAFITTDSRNDLAQSKLSALRQHTVKLSTLSTRLTAWFGGLNVEALIERSSVAREHAYPIRRAKEEAEHLMSPAEEELAAQLGMTGSGAWSRLYGNFTSQLTATVELDGAPKELPMSAVRNLASDPDRETRKRAFDAELAAWEKHAVPVAAALNSIKGEVNALSKRRGWDSALDESLFDNNMDRASLDAMLEAAHESFPTFRRYLKAKARALGIDRLAFYDLFAPVGGGESSWEYDRAARFILEQFETYSPRMKALAERAFAENWIDAEPRPGKRDGAFCMWLRRGDSRILSNYKPTYNGVNTLAHELGHAYHNLCLKDRAPLQRGTPRTLAETASTFCETIVRDAALKTLPPEEQLNILEASLQAACQIVVDITSRFQFEEAVFAQRRARELSVAELCDRMLDAQRATYGDGLDPNALHPYMWAAKPHYYGSNFYNYPYMYGLLFGLGLYARHQEDPDGFKAGYDELLSMTGMESPAELAGRFGIDVRSIEFWRSSLNVIGGEIERFEALADGTAS